MNSTYEDYRTSPTQFHRYRDAIIAFLTNPNTAFYIPSENNAPATAAVDLRALFQYIAHNPAEFANDLPFSADEVLQFYLSYAIKFNEKGVFFVRRTRNVKLRSPVKKEAPRPAVITKHNPEIKPSKSPAEPETVEAPSSEGLRVEPSPRSPSKSVHNSRLLVTVCRAMVFQCFSAPVELDGVLEPEVLEKYKKKFPELEFFSRDQTTLII